MRYTVLIADDEPEIVELLQLYLEKDYTIKTAVNGAEALQCIRSTQIDLVILDIMMPVMDGLQLIKQIRATYHMPVLFLSAKSQDHDKILGLGLGADDYIAKPFNPLEIVARVEALLRRVNQFDAAEIPEAKEQNLVLGELTLDRSQCILFRSGSPVTLTSTEYKIMELLLDQPGRVFTRKKIYEAVWGDYYAHEDSTIMVHISNIREKIERDSRQPEYLKTIRGLGYKIEAPMES
ncbi:DNA-binding response regulator [Paenibacillus sp. BGI2013]|uniref:response regulator transcription factor n=1 Tax=Paenibacillus TaxID=44249 RepID=UPI0003E276BF|nr:MULTISPECIES: response regulator transcription factor [Paenibacillus]ETT37491.1 two component transcriptional regulator, winged helix family protein [Paenibacillus sp. FSL R5-192]ETT52746.1 two component transcriptional regulator, winged helix family protein [Paenibacillus sp. FSL H7-689]OMF47553.1 DNA-binding response regulator [Paenibacillus amylolyticus]PKQ90380.1 DNA-binding response regulator [Paenibacillus sp. BGI2013]